MTVEYDIPFFHWGTLKSKDETKPDKLKLKLTQGMWETKFSPCISAIHLEQEKHFGLQYPSLKRLVEEALKNGSLSVGKEFQIITWLGISKTDNTKTPRRFSVKT